MVKTNRREKPQSLLEPKTEADKPRLSKFIKKAKTAFQVNRGKKEKNQHTFVGFYQRLSQIDVKHTHSSLGEQNHLFDNLMNRQEIVAKAQTGDKRAILPTNEMEDDLSSSNFISLLKVEKFNNRTLEFTRIFRDLEQLCFSYPLLIMNQKKVIKKLLHYLTLDSLKGARCAVLDLMIALIKDLREDIYKPFMNQILPGVVAAIDIENLDLLDKIFSLLSFAMKYLLKQIKDDISNVYDVYFELIRHKNKYVRKFASQSLCYVLRKVTFDEHLVEMLLAPMVEKEDEKLPSEHRHAIYGMSDLLFEVVSGQNMELHSKATSVIRQLLQSPRMADSGVCKKMIRTLYIKMTYLIHTSKQLPLFEELSTQLCNPDQDFSDDTSLMLMFQVFNDCVQLKFGRRVHKLTVVHMIQTLNNLLSFKQGSRKLPEFCKNTKVKLAETLAYLYYFKHGYMLEVFQKSKLDFSSTKSIFTQGIYRLVSEDDQNSEEVLEVLKAFYSLLIQPHQTVQPQSDMDIDKILALHRDQNSVTEFSHESHQEKAALLVPSFGKHLVKTLIPLIGEHSNVNSCTLSQLLALFVKITQASGRPFMMQGIPSKSEAVLTEALDKHKCRISLFAMTQFCSLIQKKENSQLHLKLKSSLVEMQKKEVAMTPSFSKPLKFKEDNFVLNSYTEMDNDSLCETINNILDLDNQAFQEQIIPCALQQLQGPQTANATAEDILAFLTPDKASNLYCLNLAIGWLRDYPIPQKANLDDNLALAKVLNQNLAKNSRSLRLTTLQLLLALFEPLVYRSVDDLSALEATTVRAAKDRDTIREHYSASCNMVELLNTFESTRISMETGKQKALTMAKVTVMCESGLVPQIYQDMVYNFAIGTLWLKFAVTVQPACEALQQLFRLNPAVFLKRHITLLQNVGLICQIAPDNAKIVEKLLSSQNMTKVSSEMVADDIQALLYSDCRKSEQDFIQVKDLHFNISKALTPVMELVWEDADLKQQMFGMYEEFMNREFLILHQFQSQAAQKEVTSKADLILISTEANRVQSESFNQYRRSAYSKVCALYTLFSNSPNLNRLSPESTQTLVSHLHLLVENRDETFQKLALACLLKTSKKQAETGGKNLTIKYPKYAKLLEGLTDDKSYTDMIPIIFHGSHSGTKENDNDEKEQTKKVKGSIPKLIEEDRQDLLPIIIKLMFSKMLRRKGAINKKSIRTRRNIVYMFMSNLDPHTEFQIFFKELFTPLGLPMDNIKDLQALVDDRDQILKKLASVSFAKMLNFVDQLEIIIKQLGSLLVSQGYLKVLTNLLIMTMAIGKIYDEHSKVEREDAEVEDEPMEEDDGKGDVNRHVIKQCKKSKRNGMKLIQKLYRKFANKPEFIKMMSEQVYQELIKDQLGLLTQRRYANNSSSLVEIVCISWSLHSTESFMNHPDVIPAIMDMLSNPNISPNVFQYHLTLVKNLVIHSLAKTEGLANIKMADDSNSESDAEDEKAEMKDNDTQNAKDLLTKYVDCFGTNLHAIWARNSDRLKDALVGQKRISGKGQFATTADAVKEQMVYQTAVKDLTFILSEMANYLNEDIVIVTSFLEMIVSLVSHKALLKVTSDSYGTASTNFFTDKAQKNEQLLTFATQAICGLISKVIAGSGAYPSTEILQKVFAIFLDLASKKVREKFATLLQETLVKGNMNTKVLALIKDLNKVKRGVADIDLDFDTVLSAVQGICALEKTEVTALDNVYLIYNIVFLVQSNEYSVRDYAQHAFEQLLAQADEATFKKCERQVIDYMKKNADELILKSILASQRALVAAASKADYGKTTLSFGLIPLIQQANGEDDTDFFSQIVSLQVKERQKALRRLTKLDSIPIYSFSEAILPLVDFLIFASKKQMQNMRNTVRYSRDQATQLLEDALNVYTSYARRLNWYEYFRLLRKLLFKLRRAVAKVNEVSAQKQDSVAEKIITKCLCKVLEGFNCKGGPGGNVQVPDAIELLEQQQRDREAKWGNKVSNRNDFSSLISQIVGEMKVKEEESDAEEALGGSSDSEEEFEPKLDPELQADVKMVEPKKEPTQIEIEQNQKFINDVQERLKTAVLPVLQRHLTDAGSTIKGKEGEGKKVRTFVAVSVAKVIRKLPIDMFRKQLHKLVNLIVTQGLRSRELNAREKARKALVKVIEEVSPRFLTLVFTEMQDLLNRGYQLHVHLYTVHYILQALNSKKENNAREESAGPIVKATSHLQPGQVTTGMIKLMSDLLLRELFGDLLEERLAADGQQSNKKHIKESKARKAMPIFEVFAQFIDFKSSFLDLIAPVIKILEENPNFSRIQQCEDLLGRVSTSILKNVTLRGEELLIFLYSIIQRGVDMAQKTKINDEKAKRDYGLREDREFIRTSEKKMIDATYGIEMKWVHSDKQALDKKTKEVCGRVLANFGLRALQKGMKVQGLILTGDEHESRTKLVINTKSDYIDKLDPFVPILLEAFNTYYNPIVVTTLNILMHVIHLGLPSFKSLLKPFLAKILKLFAQTSNEDPDFSNTLFRCAGELIRTYSVYNDLSETQIKTLVLIIKSNLQSFQTQSNVFHCLRAIIFRKFVCPDLYDVMENVQEMMVSSVTKATRSMCAQIFVQFLLDYPLEAGRIEQHINYLVKNLGYFDPEGRLQLLEVFQKLIEKLPQPLLDTYTDLFFFSLFLRLANDEKESCRQKITFCLKKLLKKTSKPRVLLQTVFQLGDGGVIAKPKQEIIKEEGDWEKASDSFEGEESEEQEDEEVTQKKESLLNGKLQLLTLFGEIGALQKEDLVKTVQLCSGIILKQADALQFKIAQSQQQDQNDSEEGHDPETMRMMNAIDLAEEANMDAAVSDPWSTIYFAVLCLQNLFGFCATNPDKGNMISTLRTHAANLPNKLVLLTTKHDNYWVRLSSQRLFGHMFTEMQNSKNAGLTVEQVFDLEAGSNDTLKLIYQFTSVYRYPQISEDMSSQVKTNLEYLIKAFTNEPREPETVAKIFKKASYIGRKALGKQDQNPEGRESVLKSIMQLYLVCIAHFKAEHMDYLKESCSAILELTHRLSTDETFALSAVKDGASEIIDTLSGAFEEKSFFIQAFQGVQQGITKTRQERKQKQKLMTGRTDEIAVQSKMRKRVAKAARTKENRQEKMLRRQLTR